MVIDQDLGHSGASAVDRLGFQKTMGMGQRPGSKYSGASAVDRLGFQRLVAEVGLGRVGLVLGLEVSRLARNGSRLASAPGDLCPDAHLDPG